MKKFYMILILLLVLVRINNLFPQSGLIYFSKMPLKHSSSPLFGQDIIIQDQPDRDQRNVAICSAFNGWLYAVYSYPEVYGTNSSIALSILKSTDNGLTWEVQLEGSTGYNLNCTRTAIVAAGNSISDLKVFIGFCWFHSNSQAGTAQIWRASGDPLVLEDGIIDEWGGVHDFAISTDYNYPANSSSPFSVALLYSKSGAKDSLIFKSSSDGGITFTRQILSTTTKSFHKVALNYGRSNSFNSGRYFAAWEIQDYLDSNLGHIYTAHTEPNINSPFTKPVCLDSLDPYTIKKARNPVIACQFNDTDNDSTNLTEIVMFEKYLEGTNSYELSGYYNLQATNSNYFKNFNASSSPENKMQPDINFNPYSSSFMLTYYDSINHKIPFLTHDFKMTYPDIWNIASEGYNDGSNITSPNPKVTINASLHEGMNVWIAEQTSGNGIALYDAPYSTYNGIIENNITDKTIFFEIYPNPASGKATIEFTKNLKTIFEKQTITTSSIPFQRRPARLEIYNSLGELMLSKEIHQFINSVELNVSEWNKGLYMARLEFKNESLGLVKFIISR